MSVTIDLFGPVHPVRPGELVEDLREPVPDLAEPGVVIFQARLAGEGQGTFSRRASSAAPLRVACAVILWVQQLEV
jgi:hypothetical protein